MITSFDQVLEIRDRWLGPDWAPNFTAPDPPGWPGMSPEEKEHHLRVVTAKTKLLSVSEAASRHILEHTYDVPPEALLNLWRLCGLRIKRLDTELRASKEGNGIPG